jgi:signal transduction histidine kinase
VVNASRHGHAKKVWVAILKQNSNLLITISNDGLPLPPKDKVREGLGLRQMQMRARLLGGTLTLQNQPPNSVLLELVIPESLLLLPAEDRVREANISSIPRTTAPYARDTAT